MPTVTAAANAPKACLIKFIGGNTIKVIDENGADLIVPVDLAASGIAGKTPRLKMTYRVPDGKLATIAIQQLDWVPGCVPDRLYRLGQPGLKELADLPAAYDPSDSKGSEACLELTIVCSADGIMETTHPLGLYERCDLKVLAGAGGLKDFRVVAALLWTDTTQKCHLIFDGDGTLYSSKVPLPLAM